MHALNFRCSCGDFFKNNSTYVQIVQLYFKRRASYGNVALSFCDRFGCFFSKTINVNTKVPNSIMDLTSCITSERILLEGIVS